MLKLISKDDVVQFQCDDCYSCHSKFGISLCKIKNRGCCHYYPKYNLFDIQRLLRTSEGKEVLDRIVNLPNVKIHNYYIHAIGYFEEDSYKKYISSEEGKLDTEEDKTIYFRACPFVVSGKGCSIEPQYRSYVCNFFICNDIKEKFKNKKEYSELLEKRDNYIKWMDYENTSLEYFLIEKKLDLVNNYKEVIDELKKIPVDDYVIEDNDLVIE